MSGTRVDESQRGSQMVEAAIIVPLLLLLLTGVVDFGRAFYDYIAIVNAAREGARVAAKLPCTSPTTYHDKIVAATKQAAMIRPGSADDIDLTSAQVTIEPSGCPTGGVQVSVTVTHSFSTVLGTLVSKDLSELTLSSRTVMSRVGRTGEAIK